MPIISFLAVGVISINIIGLAGPAIKPVNFSHALVSSISV